MKLSRAEVQHVALLARLRLASDEEARLTGELDQILTYMDKLNAVDTTHVAPFNHDRDEGPSLRADRVTNRPNADELLANAPDRDATFFKVPKILE